MQEGAHGHAEKAVQAHVTTPALEHVWQAVQEGARVVLERAAEAVLHLVQGVVQIVVVVVQAAVEHSVQVRSTNHERHKHTNNSGM